MPWSPPSRRAATWRGGWSIFTASWAGRGAELARQCAEAGARYLQIGGFSSLRPAPGAPRFVEGEIPEQFREEALEGDATRALQVAETGSDLDWLFVPLAGSYGAWAAGESTGAYRVGDEVALFEEDGECAISG